MRYNFTKEQLEELHYKKNLSIVEIAKQYGCNKDTVTLALKRFGLKSRGRIKISDKQEVVERLIELYKNTHSVRLVETETGISRKTISEILSANGITVETKEQNAKYTWKNHKHPRIGMTGGKCPVYGHKMSEETYRKMKPIWKENGNRLRKGIKKHSEGYILIYCPEHPFADKVGYVLEHRLVMEKALGRMLNKDEYVHHINGNKTDNDIKNLLLTNRSEHAKIHMEMRYKKNA